MYVKPALFTHNIKSNIHAYSYRAWKMSKCLLYLHGINPAKHFCVMRILLSDLCSDLISSQSLLLLTCHFVTRLRFSFCTPPKYIAAFHALSIYLYVRNVRNNVFKRHEIRKKHITTALVCKIVT